MCVHRRGSLSAYTNFFCKNLQKPFLFHNFANESQLAHRLGEGFHGLVCQYRTDILVLMLMQHRFAQARLSWHQRKGRLRDVLSSSSENLVNFQDVLGR